MSKFKHAPMKTQMILAMMATMGESDNKKHLLELVRAISSLLLCMHLSPLSTDTAAANCANRMLRVERQLTNKTRHCLQTIVTSRKGATSVVLALLKAVNQIEQDYSDKINSGLFSAA